MKLFIQIATILALSLLVGFSQAQNASDCWQEVKKCHDPRCRVYTIIIEPKNTPECKKMRKKLQKEFGIRSFEDEVFGEPEDTKSIPNLK
jgi:hypothetical protein